MKHLSAAVPAFAATALLCTPALAHHSQAAFDPSREVLIEGTVARLDWKNPHMYLIVETVGEDGKPQLVQAEGLSITQALVDGLSREALAPGTPVILRANPNRSSDPGKTVRALDVTTPDGAVHPFYAANSRVPALTPAASLAANWAPSLRATSAAFGAAAQWPYTEAGRAVQAAGMPEGVCTIEPTPFLAMLNELRTIEIRDAEVVILFDNSGDFGERVIQLATEHPVNVEPSLFGHAIGWWEGETLVIDTIAFEPNDSGLFSGIPSSPGKHTTERLTLTEDRLRLRYESTVEDPVYLQQPVSFTMLWDHRPDLPFSPAGEACDPEIARRYLLE